MNRFVDWLIVFITVIWMSYVGDIISPSCAMIVRTSETCSTCHQIPPWYETNNVFTCILRCFSTDLNCLRLRTSKDEPTRWKIFFYFHYVKFDAASAYIYTRLFHQGLQGMRRYFPEDKCNCFTNTFITLKFLSSTSKGAGKSSVMSASPHQVH